MTNSKKAVLVLGLTMATLCASVSSSFAQAHTRDAGPPKPPNTTTKPTGTWLPKSIAYIKGSNTSKGNQFGSAIALSADGNTLAVSATAEDSAAKGVNGVSKDHAVNAGAVYVYTRDNKGWKQQAYLKASNAARGAQFGNSLSLSTDGNLLAVGSPGEASSATGINGNQSDDSMPSSGAVYVFARAGAAWSQQAYVKSSNTGGPDVGYQFGFAVSLSGDGSTLAVSQTSDPSNATGINGDQKNTAAVDSGAVFIFSRTGNTWSQQAYVKAGTTTPGLLFGYSVGLNGKGDTLGVGAYNDSGRRGAVYVFTRNNGTWSQQTRLLATNGQVGDYLGCSMAISDDGNTIVGGTVEDKYAQINAGAGREVLDSVGGAYVFVRAAGQWSQQAYVKAFNPRENDQFGWAVAISRDGNTIAVGSHLEDSGAKRVNGDQADASTEDSGAVYVYTRTGATWNPTAYVKASNTTTAAEFGISVALNGDGKMLAVGATKENSTAKGVNGNQDDKSALNAGAAYVYY
jgi:trimeric autotransporter adhesin